jgi:hypothetical protein
MDPKPTTFSSCTNTASVDGGSDEETDLDLIDRAKEYWARRTNGSIGGLEALAEAQDYVEDAQAFDEDNEDEGLYLGSVADVWVRFASSNTVMIEEYQYWPGLMDTTLETFETFDFTPTNQPLLEALIPTVFRYTLAGVEEQVVTDSTTTVEIVKDPNTFGHSTKANDVVRVKMALDGSTYHRRIKIIYAYDKYPRTLQNVFESAENRMIGPVPLVKKGVEVPIQIVVEPQISFGYVESDVKDEIESNIEIFFVGGTTSYGKQFAQKKLGEDISQTDIESVILQTPGVASFDTDTFRIVNTLSGSLADPVVINSNQFATLYNILWDFAEFNLDNFTGSF